MAFYSWPKTTYFTPCFTLQFRGESDVNHDFMIPYGRYTSFHSERESLADCLEKLVWLLASHRISSPSITDTCTGMTRERCLNHFYLRNPLPSPLYHFTNRLFLWDLVVWRNCSRRKLEVLGIGSKEVPTKEHWLTWFVLFIDLMESGSLPCEDWLG